MTLLVGGENILKLWKIDTQYLEQKEKEENGRNEYWKFPISKYLII